MTIRRAMNRGILATLEHRCEVVDGRIRVASPHRLDEGRDDVVVLIAGTVVAQRTLAGRIGDVPLFERHVLSAWAVCQASSSVLSALRASPPARRVIAAITSSGSSAPSSAAPRAITAAISSSESGSSSMTAQRESRAELTSKYGFSVVAPMSVTQPVLDARAAARPAAPC